MKTERSGGKNEWVMGRRNGEREMKEWGRRKCVNDSVRERVNELVGEIVVQ